MGGIGIWQLLIVLVIIVLLFGSKKLRGLGGDLGSAMRGFKKELNSDKEKDEKDGDSVEHKQDAEFRTPGDGVDDAKDSENNKQRRE